MATAPSTLNFKQFSEDPDWFNAMIVWAAHDEKLGVHLAQARIDLTTKGYAVIPSLFSPGECNGLHNEFWRVVEGASGGRLTRPHSAPDLKDFKVTGNWIPNRHGICELGALSHLDFVHFVRTHPLVTYIFACLYGCQPAELVVAPDRINYQLPPEWLPRAKKMDPEETPSISKTGSWLHIDQALTAPGLRCIQGVVQLTSAEQLGDGSFNCVPYTHHLHEQIETIIGHDLDPRKRRENWFMFSDEDKATILKALRGKYEDGTLTDVDDLFKSVKAPAGSLILWDSRLWHQGGQIRACAATPRAIPEPRFCIYVCMQPRTFTPWTAKLMATKREVFEKHLATSHWPLKVKKFGAPRTYGKEAVPFEFGPYLTGVPADNSILAHLYGLTASTANSPIAPVEINTNLRLSFAASSGVRCGSAVPIFHGTDANTAPANVYFDITPAPKVVRPRVEPIAISDSEETEKKEEGEPAPKKAKKESPTSCCAICLDKPCAMVCIPCGHACLCQTCGPLQPAGEPCIICRAPVEKLLRVFFA